MTIAEFKRYLLHDDILALSLYTYEAALEILADRELYEQLSLEELMGVLKSHPKMLGILEGVMREQKKVAEVA